MRLELVDDWACHYHLDRHGFPLATGERQMGPRPYLNMPSGGIPVKLPQTVKIVRLEVWPGSFCTQHDGSARVTWSLVSAMTYTIRLPITISGLLYISRKHYNRTQNDNLHWPEQGSWCTRKCYKFCYTSGPHTKMWATFLCVKCTTWRNVVQQHCL